MPWSAPAARSPVRSRRRPASPCRRHPTWRFRCIATPSRRTWNPPAVRPPQRCGRAERPVCRWWDREAFDSDPENPLEEPCRRADRQFVGALLVLVLRHGKSVAGAAVELHLEFDLGLAEFLVN